MNQSQVRRYIAYLISCFFYMRLAESQEILYAINVSSSSESTLHTVDADSGDALDFIGTVRNVADETDIMGIFGMCYCARHKVMYAVNHLDHLVTLDLNTATASIVGPVNALGLYDLACPPPSNAHPTKNPSLLYTFGAKDGKIFTIDPTTGQATSLSAELPLVNSVSMDFDREGNLWILTNGKTLSLVDLRTGLLTQQGVLPGIHVGQRHGSIRGRVLYSAFFEADPSNLWLVDLDTASVSSVVTTQLDNTYALAFVNISDV